MAATYPEHLRDLSASTLTHINATFEQRVAVLEAKIDLRLAQLELRLTRRSTTLGFWMLQFVTAVLVVVAVKLAR